MRINLNGPIGPPPITLQPQRNAAKQESKERDFAIVLVYVQHLKTRIRRDKTNLNKQFNVNLNDLSIMNIYLCLEFVYLLFNIA